MDTGGYIFFSSHIAFLKILNEFLYRLNLVLMEPWTLSGYFLWQKLCFQTYVRAAENYFTDLRASRVLKADEQKLIK
jgi:hypothetical protein